MPVPNPKPTRLNEWASSATTVSPWQASTAYTAGTLATNGGNVYEVVADGTSAGSGGPAGTGQAIVDGTVTWRFLGKAGTAGGITEPSAGRKGTGWLAGEKPPHGYFNWWQNLTYLWTRFLDTLHARVNVWLNGSQFRIPPAWMASTAYTFGQFRTNGGNVYRVKVAGTSAASGGPTGTGTAIVDGTVTWSFVSQAGATVWTASTAYVVGEHVYNLGNVYECTVAGTSAASGGPSGTGASIVDNTVTWTWAGVPFEVEREASFRAPVDMDSTLNVDGATALGSTATVSGLLTASNGATVNGAVLNATAAATVTRSTPGDALATTGNGSGAGLNTTGGATGPGATVAGGFTSGNGLNITTTNGHGINVNAAGGGSNGILSVGPIAGNFQSTAFEGIISTGAAGSAGVVARNGTAATAAVPRTALILDNGYLSLAGAANPNSNVAFSNALTPTNINKAHAAVVISGGALGSPVGFNISSVTFQTFSGTDDMVRFTFAQPFSSIEYTCVPGVQSSTIGPVLRFASVVAKATTHVDVVMVALTSAPSIGVIDGNAPSTNLVLDIVCYGVN